jgi:hypothetical protein
MGLIHGRHHDGSQGRRPAPMRATLVQRSAESIEFARLTPGEYQPAGSSVQSLTADHPVRKAATELTAAGAGRGGSAGNLARPDRNGTCYRVCTMVRGLLAVLRRGSVAQLAWQSWLPCLAVVLGCASPTLPLPPPEDPTISPGADADHVRLGVPCGGASPGAIIVIVNTNTTVPPDQAVSGALVTDCGAWDSIAYAHKGDFLTITQEIGTLRSQPAVVQVH